MFVNKQSKDNKFHIQKANIRSPKELRHIKNVSEFFFCRILSEHNEGDVPFVKKITWQPYFAEYP